MTVTKQLNAYASSKSSLMKNKLRFFTKIFPSLIINLICYSFAGFTIFVNSEVFGLDNDIYAETMDWIQSDLMTSCDRTCKDQIPDEFRPQTAEKQVFQSKVKKKPVRYEGSNFFVFVSFSMPKQGLLDLCKEIVRAGGVPVLRGLYKNSFKETGLIMQEVVKASGQGMLIDPNLYEKYQIRQVPSFVVTDQKQFDKLYGYVSVQYALEQFKESGDLKSLAEYYYRKGSYG